MSKLYFKDFDARDRASLRAAYAEGDAAGRDRFAQLWMLADIHRAHGIRNIREAATIAALEVYVS